MKIRRLLKQYIDFPTRFVFSLERLFILNHIEAICPEGFSWKIVPYSDRSLWRYLPQSTGVKVAEKDKFYKLIEEFSPKDIEELALSRESTVERGIVRKVLESKRKGVKADIPNPIPFHMH